MGSGSLALLFKCTFFETEVEGVRNRSDCTQDAED